MFDFYDPSCWPKGLIPTTSLEIIGASIGGSILDLLFLSIMLLGLLFPIALIVKAIGSKPQPPELRVLKFVGGLAGLSICFVILPQMLGEALGCLAWFG